MYCIHKLIPRYRGAYNIYLLHTLVMHWITLGKKKLIICWKGENVEFGIQKPFISLQIRIMFMYICECTKRVAIGELNMFFTLIND